MKQRNLVASGRGITTLGAAMAAAVFCLLFAAGPANAATLVVDDDLSCSGATYATIGAAEAAASPGDTIDVCAGTYAENVLVDVADLTVTGAGPGSTIVTPAPGVAFRLSESGFTLSDLAISGGSQGLRVESAGNTITGTEVDNVVFSGLSSNAIELHNATTIVDLTVTDIEVYGGNAGIRSSSGTPVDGLSVSGSLFDGSTYGIYHASSSQLMQNLHVDASTFTNLGYSGIYAERLADALVENSDLVDNRHGAILYFPSGSYEGIEFHQNNIAGNTGFGLWEADSAGGVDATCNWWGDESGPSGEGTGTGDTVSGDIEFTPWLRDPAPGGACTGGLPQPQSKADCKNGGWQSLYDDEGRPFKNQGDCVSFASTGGKNKAAG